MGILEIQPAHGAEISDTAEQSNSSQCLDISELLP